MYQCAKCGQCCRNLHLNALYKDLDRGDGVCKFLQGNLCSIYDSRPLKCRIDLVYDLYFYSVCTKEEYYQLNTNICKQLTNIK